jgi:putative phosphoserine phosphatase/1-acylglycerol-3-phosphate O-acyltransferase
MSGTPGRSRVPRVPAPAPIVRSRPAPPPGTPADVRRAGSGPTVGAFFDFDGTVIAGFSASVFAKDRLRRRQVGAGEVLRSVRFAIDASAGRVDLADMLGLTARSWKGYRHEDMLATSERLFDAQIARAVFPEMRQLIREHLARGHTVALTSSATTYQLRPAADLLGVQHLLCTRLELVDDVLTGEVEGVAPWGAGKAAAVQEFAAAHGVDLAQSFAYADGDEDIPLLHLVGQPRAVNPGSRLAAVAKRRGWPVLRLSSRGGDGSVTMRTRNVVGTAAIVPAAAVGVAVGLAKRNKRAGVDVGFPAWVDVLLRVNGVSVDVVGRANASSDRPCVFIHNHLTNFDSFLMVKVLRGGVSGVGKKEITKNPLGALMGWALDAAMIDRSDSAGAIQAMRPLVDRLGEGVSIVIAPEGTRSVTGELAPFKKGPFHIAMQAGVPIVPIVLRNADVLGTASATMMRPGVVEMAVLPAVSTKGWTVATLSRHVAEVHQLYVDALRDWPTEEDVAPS